MVSKISELLTKVNALLLQRELNQLSPIEIDLAKQYLRKIYDLLSAPPITTQKIEVVQERVKETVYEPNFTSSSKPVNIAETVQTTVSLNEKKFSSGLEMHRVFATKPLRELIDFNKRFAIVNELFKGDTAAFQNAIISLDSFENYEAAETNYAKLATDLAWDTNSQTAKMLAQLIKQRFGEE